MGELEDKIRRDLDRAMAADPTALGLATGQISGDDLIAEDDVASAHRLIGATVRTLAAQREAILEIAREVDDLRTG